MEKRECNHHTMAEGIVFFAFFKFHLEYVGNSERNYKIRTKMSPEDEKNVAPVGANESYAVTNVCFVTFQIKTYQ